MYIIKQEFLYFETNIAISEEVNSIKSSINCHTNLVGELNLIEAINNSIIVIMMKCLNNNYLINH